MREIKFRAWEITGKVMVDWNTMMQTAFNRSGEHDKFGLLYRVFTRKPDMVLMQFTGLLDKSGKEIYEGDILRLYGNALAQMTWVDRAVRMIGFGAVEFRRGDERVIDTADVKTFAREMGRSEVIGNIYENPELLK